MPEVRKKLASLLAERCHGPRCYGNFGHYYILKLRVNPIIKLTITLHLDSFFPSDILRLEHATFTINKSKRSEIIYYFTFYVFDKLIR